jgi:hypothetical protein
MRELTFEAPIRLPVARKKYDLAETFYIALYFIVWKTWRSTIKCRKAPWGKAN